MYSNMSWKESMLRQKKECVSQGYSERIELSAHCSPYAT
jgi:hypothetical protein